MAPNAVRELTGFGAAFGATPELKSGQKLSALLGRLPTSHNYSCAFRAQYAGKLAPLAMLMLERLLKVFVALRVGLVGSTVRAEEKAVLPMDYRAVRAMLTNMPLASVDRPLSASALVTAEGVFAAVNDDGYQLSLSDKSADGNKWFAREEAMKWTGLGYTTVKKHLGELENAGILLSTLAVGDRGRGKQIHYRFDPEAAPPFQSQNPFDGLPDLAGEDRPHE
jgi:hypothetical protein